MRALSEIAKTIDHTLLKSDASESQVLQLCAEAEKFGFHAVCVNPAFVALARKRLPTAIHVAAVIGFPLGANIPAVKSLETRQAIRDGADEIDMVIALYAVKSGDWRCVKEDLDAVMTAAEGRLVKVILETSLLTEEEKRRCCELCAQAGAGFVKTSTGFAGGGATEDDVRNLKAWSNLPVKASGGLRTLDEFNRMLDAGAARLGTSSAAKLFAGGSADRGSY